MHTLRWRRQKELRPFVYHLSRSLLYLRLYLGNARLSRRSSLSNQLPLRGWLLIGWLLIGNLLMMSPLLVLIRRLSIDRLLLMRVRLLLMSLGLLLMSVRLFAIGCLLMDWLFADDRRGLDGNRQRSTFDPLRYWLRYWFLMT